MQKGNKKEKWGKPKLIILTRGKPEERVLVGCKWTSAGGPLAADNACGASGSGCRCYNNSQTS